ncbi:hypothetical protein ACFOGI_09495 [Virgibacillus xinjiangensis]|uniref:Uncharacterized protein n=1 Tax=Virgibacillus xinjiangensis TaxID=393090 RepID=A0ABV7CVY9_9BACI
MAAVSKLFTIGIILLSITAGLISYRFLGELSKEKKKKHMEELISQLINFVIFIWLAKILLNISLFISDPLVVLAYPAGSDAFYLAVVFSASQLFYKSRQGHRDMLSFMDAFVHTFLVASFVYEFIQLVWNGDTYAFGYLSVLITLLAVYILIHGYVKTEILLMVMLIGWTAGMILLSRLQPFVSVFGYLMEEWFILLFFMTSLMVLIFCQRKKGY